MKKLLIVLFGAMTVLAACGGESTEPAKTDETTQTTTQAESSAATETDEASYYEVTVPAGFAFDIEEDEDTNLVFDSITRNADGSITYIIEESLYDEFMPELALEFETIINDLVNEYPSYQSIEYTDAFDTFDIRTDYTQYDEEADAEALFTLILLSGTYNAFAGYEVTDMALTFNLIDDATDEVLETLVYPDNF